MIAQRILPLSLFFCGLACRSATLAGRTPIAPEQVAIVMNAAGLHVTPQQVVLPGYVVASRRDPVLKIGEIEHWGDRRLRVRIECASREECIPFFVGVRGVEAAADLGEVGVGVMAPVRVAEPKASSGTYLVRAGDLANLALEGPHLHIQLAAICLESGRAGQTIRVASKDRRQTFSAEIVSRNELKGRVQ